MSHSPSETPATRPGLRARLTSPTGQAVAVLVGITLAFYHGLWLPALVLIKRDASWFYLPIKQSLIERLSAGELPQWFPYEALGRSFIGATATGVVVIGKVLPLAGSHVTGRTPSTASFAVGAKSTTAPFASVATVVIPAGTSLSSGAVRSTMIAVIGLL